MTAKEMFEELGYDLVEDDDVVIYEKILGDCNKFSWLEVNELSILRVKFDKLEQTAEVAEFVKIYEGSMSFLTWETYAPFDFKTTMAINQQSKELGWLNQ